MNELVPTAVLAAGVAALVAGRLLLRAPAPPPGVARPSDVPAAPVDRDASVVGRALRATAARVGPASLSLVRRTRRERIHDLLEAAGHPAGMTTTRFVGCKVVFTAAFGAAGSLHALNGRPFVATALLAAGWFSMDVWLNRAVRSRQARLDRELPAFLDVLAVSVTAGVPLVPALEAVAGATGGALGDEVRRALDAVAVGDRLEGALGDLRRRNPAPALGRAVAALTDTLELGTPLAETLARISADVRQRHREEVLARASRTAPRISLIVAFTLVPACLAVIATALLLEPTTALWDAFGR